MRGIDIIIWMGGMAMGGDVNLAIWNRRGIILDGL
jgi:hypothetical protein